MVFVCCDVKIMVVLLVVVVVKIVVLMTSVCGVDV